MKRLALAVCAAMLVTQPALAKEDFNIRGIKPGDTIEDIKKVFPKAEVSVDEAKIYDCDGKKVIGNGYKQYKVRVFDGNTKEKWTYNLVDVDDNILVYEAEYSKQGSYLNKDAMIKLLRSKYYYDDEEIEEYETVSKEGNQYNYTTLTVQYSRIINDKKFTMFYRAYKYNHTKRPNKNEISIIESSLLGEHYRREEADKLIRADLERRCAEKETKKLNF